MAKNFDTKATTAKFFTGAQDPPLKEKVPGGVGRPRLTPEQKKRGRHYNLMLDKDLDRFLHEIVWVRRTNMTQYVNDLIRADYDKYLQDCQKRGVDPFEGWEKDDEQ